MMSSVSHPDHPLQLKENVIIGVDDAICYGCNKPVIGSPTYICTSYNRITCQSFYLHKTCAELPTQITNHKHKIHPLNLLPHRDCICDVCGREWEFFTYPCEGCEFDVCVFCDFEQRMLDHDGHKKHTLTLMRREALFKCDVCGEEARDSSYSCNPCEFWIHKSFAFLPFILPAPYHHHPMNLIFSIPEMHHYFYRVCVICDKKIYPVVYWLYYCQKCTYLVYVMKCATSSNTVSAINEIESDNQSDLVEFPLCSKESFFELITSQCCKLQLDFQGEHENSTAVLTMPTDPLIIEEHWSHKSHPLNQLQIVVSDDDDDICHDTKVLICDGCIQPITASYPSYYACVECDFFLYSLCATKLPQNLNAGSSSFHPSIRSCLSRGLPSTFLCDVIM